MEIGHYFLVLFPVLILMMWGMVRSEKERVRELRAAWESWPTLAQYFREFPQAKTPYGPACRHCSSRNIFEYRWDPEMPEQMRIHRCRSCNRGVYRSVKNHIT